MTGDGPATTDAVQEIKAVLWDFGGVILESPFDAFARYESEHDLPPGFLRRLNATNPDRNAWARMERGDLTVEEFCGHFEDEARAAGGSVVAADVLNLLSGQVRPEMVEAVRRCRERLKTALLTNNFHGFADDDGGSGAGRPELAEIVALFDVVVESSQVGIRKPDPAFYEMACDRLGIAASDAVFLDDLGVNLKPARAMGMATIKVGDPVAALAELEAIVGFPLG